MITALPGGLVSGASISTKGGFMWDSDFSLTRQQA
jgi:hypothetical protein